jgi:hypothetical protein
MLFIALKPCKSIRIIKFDIKCELHLLHKINKRQPRLYNTINQIIHQLLRNTHNEFSSLQQQTSHYRENSRVTKERKYLLLKGNGIIIYYLTSYTVVCFKNRTEDLCRKLVNDRQSVPFIIHSPVILTLLLWNIGFTIFDWRSVYRHYVEDQEPSNDEAQPSLKLEISSW